MLILSLILGLPPLTPKIDFKDRFERASALVATLTGPVDLRSGKTLIRTLKPGDDEGFPLLAEETLEPHPGNSIVIMEGRRGVIQRFARKGTVPSLTLYAAVTPLNMTAGAARMGTASFQLPFPGDMIDPGTIELTWLADIKAKGALDVSDVSRKNPDRRFSIPTLADGKLTAESSAALRAHLLEWSKTVRRVRFELQSADGNLDKVEVQLVPFSAQSNLKLIRSAWQTKRFAPYKLLSSLGLALELRQQGLRTAAYQALGIPKPKAHEPDPIVWLRKNLETGK